MRRAKSLKLSCIVVLATFIAFPIYPASSDGESDDPLHDISKYFPYNIQTESDGHGRLSLEYCPDNTCGLFVANGEITLDELKEFAFLYLYFFSNYYVFQKWQKNNDPSPTAERILSKARYQGCKREIEDEIGRCALLLLRGENQIAYYFIRHDEGQRTVEEYDIFRDIVVPPSQPK